MARKHFRSKQLVEEKKEFEEEVLQIDRVTRVVKGGRRLSFRATVIIGNKKGKVAIGLGKATEVAAAIQKALSQAKKNIVRVPIVRETIPHEINVKFKSAKLLMMPASKGTGVIAGGATRKILKLAGVHNILSKSFGTNNRLVCAQATIKALQELPNIGNSKDEDSKNKGKKEDKKEVAEKKSEKKDDKKIKTPKKD